MIEEMARAMCPNSKEWTCKACSGSAKPDCDAYENAEKLVNAGCRIIAEDSVVLSGKEWKNLCKEKNDYKQRFKSSEKRYEQLVQSSCEALEKKGKETAEKVLKWLVETGVINTAPDTTKMYFKEEFGVDLKGEE